MSFCGKPPVSQSLTKLFTGVGMGLNPPQWLKPGDQVEVSISKIGTLRNGVEYA